MTIVIDFDEICVTHEYPEYPEARRYIGVKPLKAIVKTEPKLIIWARRSEEKLQEIKK